VSFETAVDLVQVIKLVQEWWDPQDLSVSAGTDSKFQQMEVVGNRLQITGAEIAQSCLLTAFFFCIT